MSCYMKFITPCSICTDMSQCNGSYETRLPIMSETRDRVRARKRGGETYDEVIQRLLESGSSENNGSSYAS